eukprot:267684-Amphidinium_carterae.1
MFDGSGGFGVGESLAMLVPWPLRMSSDHQVRDHHRHPDLERHDESNDPPPQLTRSLEWNILDQNHKPEGVQLRPK